MPNYKTFQDYADSLRVRIYGSDDANNIVPLLTDASGKMDVVGTVGVSGSVAVSGNVGVSGTVAVSGNVGVSGTVAVSGNVGVSGTVAISGTVGVFLSGRNTLDSGPVAAPWSGSSSGTADGVWDVLGYNSWTLAVKFSGTSGEAVSAKLQMSVIGSGESTWIDQDVYKNFSGTSWNFYTTNYHVRYARMWGQNTSTTDSGALLVYFQGEY